MHEVSLAFASLLAVLLLQIKQHNAGDSIIRAGDGITKSVKSDTVRADSNGQDAAMDLFEDLKHWDSLFSTNEFRKNERRLNEKLPITFRVGSSTQLKIQNNIQFYQRKKSSVAVNNIIETFFTKSQIQNSRKVHPRTTRDLSSASGDLGNKFQENSSCTSNENFTLSCHEELSCRNRCQHPLSVLNQTQLSCFCDEDCNFFQDCCADYDVFCGRHSTQNTSSSEKLVTKENRDLWKCYEGEEVRGANGVWMIGSCPSSWPEDDVLYRCRNLSSANTITKDNYRYLPVYTKNGKVLYHNRFCAQCNGVSPKDMNNFTLSIECDFNPPQHLSLDDKIRFLFQYCSEKINWKGGKGHPRRYCIDFETRNQDNPFEIRNSEHQFKCTQGKPRVVGTAQKIYKNVECAKYLGERPQCLSCGPNISSSESNSNTAESGLSHKPLSLIFEFNPGKSFLNMKTQCQDSKVYDHYLEICRQGISPGVPVNASYLSLYQVVIWVLPPDGLSSCFQEAIAHYFLTKALGISQQKVRTISVAERENPTRTKIQFTLEITQSERSLMSIKRVLDFTSPFNISVFVQIFTVVKATKRILSCVNRQKYDRSEYTVLQDDSSTVVIKKTGEVFQFTDYYLNTTEATSANDSQAIFVCRHQISNCSGVYILINEGEFRVLMNKSIFVNASKQVYHWLEYTWINKSVLVCENFSTTYYQSKVVSKDDAVLTTITLVCMSLSIIGLVFVLVTYSLFSELRTPPGINLMNLSVSILLAQLLWLLGSGQTDTPIPCTVIAILLHYLFLVSFVWTSIIAFDTWRAFSAKGRRPLADSRSKRMKHCLRHMAIGWLPVMIYVAICVALDLTDTGNIGYISKNACWMGNKWASLYYFAVPVALLLIVNTVFYFKTFKAIKVTTTQARAVVDQNTKKNFGIYVRIASLMGFTWIFGFVSPFDWRLSYPFIILSGLQGVYIALAFPLSKRARSLYKELLTGKSSSQDTTVNSSIPRTKAQEPGCSKKSSDTKL